MRMLWVLLVLLLLAVTGMVEAAGVRLDWDYTQGSSVATKFRVYRRRAVRGRLRPSLPMCSR